MEEISWGDFAKVDMRVGTIVSAEVFDKARKPAYIITADFGALGVKKTSAQVTTLYQPEELVGKQIIGVVNFPQKQIANLMSEFLLLGAVNGDDVTLLSTDKTVHNGLKIS